MISHWFVSLGVLSVINNGNDLLLTILYLLQLLKNNHFSWHNYVACQPLSSCISSNLSLFVSPVSDEVADLEAALGSEAVTEGGNTP